MVNIRRELSDIVAGNRGRDTLNLFTPPEWTERALCAEVGPDLFFLEKGGDSKPAKQICAKCPVTEECLEYALAYEAGQMGTATSYAVVGVYGGKGPVERRKILRERARENAA